MERLMRKLSQRYKRAKDETCKWDGLQSHLLSLFSNASAILDRLPVLVMKENYGALNDVDNITTDLPAKQVESLENIFLAMHNSLNDMDKVWKALEKIWRDACQLLKAEKMQPTQQQAQKCYGLRPSINQCLDGLEALYVMHRDEYVLKFSIISALSYDIRSHDLVALQSLLTDQPNIPKNEVKFIFDIFYAGENS
eukprot:c13925_g1_i1 orf=458-1045(-)